MMTISVLSLIFSLDLLNSLSRSCSVITLLYLESGRIQPVLVLLNLVEPVFQDELKLT